MFQGDLNQGSFHERSFFIVFSFIFFWLFVSLSSLFSTFFYALAYFYFFYGVSSISFGTLFSSHLPSNIRHLITYSLLEKSFAFAPSVGGDPWSGYWKKIIRLKGETIDNFSISVKGWWKMAISHLKYSYLDWRAIPCRRETICVYTVFSLFSQHFFYSCLDLIKTKISFKCMTWQSIFLLFFFLFSRFVCSGQRCVP